MSEETLSTGMRILVIDDDESIREGIATYLAVSGWEIAKADSGRQPFREFDRFSPDIILLDVHLPDMSGLDILDQIKAVSESTAAIMMSGAGTIDIAVNAMKKGAETFIQKPFTMSSLDAILKHVSKAIATRRELSVLRRNAQSRDQRFPGTSAAAKSLEQVIV